MRTRYAQPRMSALYTTSARNAYLIDLEKRCQGTESFVYPHRDHFNFIGHGRIINRRPHCRTAIQMPPGYP
jgi:hypothetical protein